jgi:diguanylate cyclase (GGDEF)-like protein
MTTRSARWGVLLLLFSIVVAAAIGLLAVVISPPSQVVLETILPIVAIALGVVALFAGHISYPRVQNLKVYLAGYSVGVQSILYAVFVGFAPRFGDTVPTPPAGYAEALLVVALAGTILYSLVTAYPTYRTTRIVTLVLGAAQLLLLSFIRFFPATVQFLGSLHASELISITHAVVATVAVGVVVINALLTPQSFYLRGAFSGLALLAGISWLLPTILHQLSYTLVSQPLIWLLYVCAAPLVLVVSTIAHVVARMEHRVSYDPLLQIYNREYCNQIIAEQSSLSTRPPIAVMMIDIDKFKQVNDTYGHQAGDRILFGVAQTVQKAIVPEGVVCRYGGEELIVFIPARTGRDVVPLAQRLRLAVEKMETPYKKHRIGVTISVGISDRKSPRQALPQVVHAADKALYLAKENGRNQVRFMRIREQKTVSSSRR